jgi:hypothetical protein
VGSWVSGDGGGGGGGYVGGGGGGGSSSSEIPESGGAGGTDFCGGSGVTCGATNAGAGTGTGGVTITYSTLSLPTARKQCREGGWKNFGAMFKNHGACVDFVVHENRAARLQRSVTTTRSKLD